MAKKKMGLGMLALLGVGGYMLYKKLTTKKTPPPTKAQAAAVKSKFEQPGPGPEMTAV
jgi:hypothetical protein